MALPFTFLKSILRQKKKNYIRNLNISPCKNIINLPKTKPKKTQNPSTYIIYSRTTNL
jgi:hypothetical protein